jgi:hypothetical protein
MDMDMKEKAIKDLIETLMKISGEGLGSMKSMSGEKSEPLAAKVSVLSMDKGEGEEESEKDESEEEDPMMAMKMKKAKMIGC